MPFEIKGLADRLRQLRAAAGLSLRALQEKSGVDQAYLSDLERGKRTRPRADIIWKLAKAYDRSPKWLASGEGLEGPFPERIEPDEAEWELLGLWRRLPPRAKTPLEDLARQLAPEEVAYLQRQPQTQLQAAEPEPTGHYHRREDKSRPTHVRLRLVGYVAAGGPDPVVERLSDEIDVPQEFVPEELTRPKLRVQAVKARGTSMVDADIADGDVLVLASVTDRQPVGGDIVIALIDGDETTVKHWYPAAGGRHELRPANEELESKTYPAERVEIQSVVVSVWTPE